MFPRHGLPKRKVSTNQKPTENKINVKQKNKK
jgi:hypothetical protein